jgi:hypothetical protein
MFEWLFNRFRDSVGNGDPAPASSVPEMDAASGILAIAVVLAALALAWEIRRRRRAQG